MINKKDKKPTIGSIENAQKPKLAFDRKYTSRDSYEFDPNEDAWKLNNGPPIYFHQLRKLTAEESLFSIKRVMLDYVAEYSSSYLGSINQKLVRLYKATGPEVINSTNLMNYRAMLDETHESSLGSLRAFLRTWQKKGYAGITKDAIEYLEQQKLKGEKKGVAVQLLDTLEGPFSDIEKQAVHELGNTKYREGIITTAEYVSVLLVSNLGTRSIQLAKTKIKDLVKAKKDNGEPGYFLRVPRAKNGLRWRNEFNPKPLNQFIWEVVQVHAQDLINSVKSSFPEIEDTFLQELPLFPNWEYIDRLKSVDELRDSLHPDLDVAHSSSRDFAVLGTGAIEKLEVYSERTGEILKANLRRFRYTLGSNLAREGISDAGIAEALDHSDLQNAGVYTKNHPDVIEAIGKAVDMAMIPLAQAFNGTLVDYERDAINGDNKNKRIRFVDEVHNVNLATCGEQGYCTDYAPIACYTCGLFQPWVDAPHEIILEYLVNERKRIADITHDERVTSVQDRTILAVIEVIKKCEARKEEQRENRSRLEVIS
jgi:hypothetical protein